MTAGNYLFIDGNYLMTYYNKMVKQWFGMDGEVDFRAINRALSVEKTFYYDCKDEIKRSTENDLSYQSRVTKQELFFNKIREVRGTHIRLGHLTGSKESKLRQKEVDILLAVDMMNHAIRGNMKRTFLLSGDRDFKPLVESLVQMGLFVEILADPNHISEEFAYSADGYRKLTIRDYHQWSTEALQKQFPLPSITGGASPPQDKKPIKHGSYKGKNIQVYQDNDYMIYMPLAIDSNNGSHTYKFNDTQRLIYSNNLEKLELFFNLMHGPIEWI